MLHKVASHAELDEHDDEILAALNRCEVRETDTVVLLHRVSAPPESFTLKNLVVKMDGAQSHFPVMVCSSSWCHGISSVRLATDQVEAMLARQANDRGTAGAGRAELLRKLQAIPNEVGGAGADSGLSVGPRLAADASGRDLEADWTAGLDTRNSVVGLYTREEERQSKAPRRSRVACRTPWLPDREGGAGRGQRFASVVEAACRDGRTLDEFFTQPQVLTAGDEHHGDASADAPRRADDGRGNAASRVTGGRRNRARLILKAAHASAARRALGDRRPRHAEGSTGRLALLTTDVQSNTFVVRRRPNSTQAEYIYYAARCSTAAKAWSRPTPPPWASYASSRGRRAAAPRR